MRQKQVGALLLAWVLCAGSAAAQVVAPVMPEDGGPGYPPKMGEITGHLGKKAVAWETYDFSIGAFDASAWADQNDGPVVAHLIGYLPGKPKDRRQRIRIEGQFGPALRTGAAEAPLTVELVRGEHWDGPRMTSEGQTAEFVIDSIGPKVENSYSRLVRGHVTARLCPKDWAFKSCQDVTLQFDTEMQVSNALEVK